MKNLLLFLLILLGVSLSAWGQNHTEVTHEDASDGSDANHPVISAKKIFTINSGASNGMTPRVLSIQDGSSAAYLTGLTALTPSLNVTLWNGTPQFQAQYGAFAHRIDLITKPSTDVQSSVGLGVVVTAHSTNSGGAATYNNTTQVGILGNSSAVDAGASASVEGINAIAGTSYTGSIPQHVIGLEGDVTPNRDSTAEGGTTGAYTIGGLFSNNSTNVSQTDGTFGVMARGVDANDSWKTGGFFSGRLCGVCIGTENSVTPDVGQWIRNATTWGIYVGSRAIESSSLFNSTMSLGNPAVGIELGEQGSTSADSNTLRLSSRDAGGVQRVWDIKNANASQNLQFLFAGAGKLQLTNAGLFGMYAGTTTSAQGVAWIPCSTSQKSESAADTNVLTCAIPATAGTYRLGFSASISAASSATLGWTATWTDSNANARTPTNLPVCLASTGTCGATSGAISAADALSGTYNIDVNNAGTSIVIKLTFSGTSFTAKVSATVERII